MSDSLRKALHGKTRVGDAGLGARLFEYARQAKLNPALLELLDQVDPGQVQELHERDVAAGAEILVTNSFRSDALSLAEFGQEAESHRWARSAARLTRRVAVSTASAREIFVLGSLGPGPGANDEHARWEDHFEAARGLLEGGADGLLIETVRHSGRAVAVIEAANRARVATSRDQVPVLLSFTPDQNGRLVDGAQVENVARSAAGRIDALGLNCVPLDVEGLSGILERLARLELPLFLAPNPAPGKTGMVEFADGLKRLALEHGLAFVRGCCGSTSEHVAALRARF